MNIIYDEIKTWGYECESVTSWNSTEVSHMRMWMPRFISIYVSPPTCSGTIEEAIVIYDEEGDRLADFSLVSPSALDELREFLNGLSTHGGGDGY